MKRLILIGAAAGGALAVRRIARGMGGLDFGKWIAAMPDDAPPKWMFNNISAIRANTERILDLLQQLSPERPAAVPAAARVHADV